MLHTDVTILLRISRSAHVCRICSALVVARLNYYFRDTNLESRKISEILRMSAQDVPRTDPLTGGVRGPYFRVLARQVPWCILSCFEEPFYNSDSVSFFPTKSLTRDDKRGVVWLVTAGSGGEILLPVTEPRESWDSYRFRETRGESVRVGIYYLWGEGRL